MRWQWVDRSDHVGQVGPMHNSFVQVVEDRPTTRPVQRDSGHRRTTLSLVAAVIEIVPSPHKSGRRSGGNNGCGARAPHAVTFWVMSRAENETMDEQVARPRDDVTAGLQSSGGGREKGVWGVERACHTGQHRSLQSVCVTQKIRPDLGSRVLSRYAATTV
jgi:hypothetical protein